MLNYLFENSTATELVSSWGVNDWYFNAQRNIPAYLLSTPNGTIGGLLGTYYADTEFSQPIFWEIEAPNRDWGLFPPNGLPSNNFSVIWEGLLTVPVDTDVQGWLGVAVSPNATARLYIDDTLIQNTELSMEGTIQSNIPGYKFTSVNSTSPPAGGAPFSFSKGNIHRIRLELQAWNLFEKRYESMDMQVLSSKVELFWNLVDCDDSIKKVEPLQFRSILMTEMTE
jgi:hypothetical protein